MNYPYCPKDFELAKRYAQAVFSMNDLYQETMTPSQDPIANEVFCPTPLVEIPYQRVETWPQIRQLLLEVYQGYTGIDNEIRKCYMCEQILSVITLGEMVFEKKQLPYLQLVSSLLRIDPTPYTKAEMDGDKKRLAQLLSDKNYRGTLQEQVTAWRQDHLVPRQELQQVIDTLIAQTQERSVDLGLTAIADMQVKGAVVGNAGFQGYCDFDNRTIYINGDLPFTYEDLKSLICHETFPGHMAHMMTRQQLLEQGKIPVDAAMVVVDTASSPIFEGLADNGVRFIGMEGSVDDEINAIYQGLKAKAGLTGAYLLHGEGKSQEEVAQYIKEAIFADDVWIQSRLRLMTYPLRKPFLPNYWRGNEVVYSVYRDLSREQAAPFIRYLYHNMHSANTIKKFRA